MSRPNVLLLANTTHSSEAVLDHIHAVTTCHAFNFHVVNPLTFKIIDKIDFSLFDAIGVHYSVKLYQEDDFSFKVQKKIASYTGLKFLFVQDEFFLIHKIQDLIYRLGFEVLFTLLEQKFWAKAYPDPRLIKLKKVQVLASYVSDDMKFIDTPAVSERPIDVSYCRGHDDAWSGPLAQEHHEREKKLLSYLKQADLTLDLTLQEVSHVCEAALLNVLMRSKVVFCSGSTQNVWTLEDRLIYPSVSSRLFEAVATRTPLILFSGDYEGILKPHEHYIPLEKDFSNINDVLDRIRHLDELQAMADAAYADLIESNAYSQHQLSQTLNETLLPRIQGVQTSSLGLVSYLDETMKKHRFSHLIRCLCSQLRSFIRRIQVLLRSGFAFIHN
ncbi:MAG: hypothetical protein ACOYKA_01770 [Legionellaceae bacterium]